MRHFAVILVSALVMTTAIYGLPAGGYGADSESYLTGLDSVDWNSVKNGGFAYVNTVTDPKTGQPTTKVTNSKSPWSEDANAKLSSGTGIAVAKPSLLYDDSDYNAPKDNTPLTKEEQQQYDWLVANLLPPTTKTAEKKKPDPMELNEDQQNQYDWLKANIKPATNEDMKALPQPSTNKATRKPIYGNRVYAGGDATPTAAGATYPTSSNDDYMYPSLESDLTPTTKVQPNSYARPTSYGSRGGRQQPLSSSLSTPLSLKPTFSSPAVVSPSYNDDLYSADLTTTGAASTYPRYSTNSPTSAAGSLYPSPVNRPSLSLQPSNGRYTGGGSAQTAGTYNRGSTISPRPSAISSQKTFTPYTDKDSDTMVLTKDNIDNFFPDNDGPVSSLRS